MEEELIKVDMNEVFEIYIYLSQIKNIFIQKKNNSEVNALVNRKPMKRVNDWCYVLRFVFVQVTKLVEIGIQLVLLTTH